MLMCQSVRAQAVLSDLRSQPDVQSRASHVLSLFFHHQRAVDQTLEAVLGSLLRQLISHQDPFEVPQSILDDWVLAKLTGKRPLPADKIRMALEAQLVLKRPGTVFLVVDAVDEAGRSQDKIERAIRNLRHAGVTIFSTVRRDPRNKYDKVYCYYCAKDPPLELYYQCQLCIGRFGGALGLCQDCYVRKSLRCHDANHTMKPPGRVNIEMKASLEDFEGYVSRFLDDELTGGDTGDDDDMFTGDMTRLSALGKRLGPDFYTALPKQIVSAADGNYLYAQLFLGRLKLQRTSNGAIDLAQKLVDGTLGDFGEQYDDMIKLCLDGKDKYGRQVARDHLAMVSSASGILTFDQLSHAVAIRPHHRTYGDFIGDCCEMDTVRRDTNGLLSISETGKFNSFPVGFFHRSLSTYLEEKRLEWFPDADQQIFDACLSYLGLDVFSRPFRTIPELEQAVDKYPFVSYAACHWGSHVERARSSGPNILRMLNFLEDEQRLACAMQLAWHTGSSDLSVWDVDRGVSPMHICAFHGLEILCRALLSIPVLSFDDEDGTYHQTPLIYACRRGHHRIVTLLSAAGADINHVSRHGRTPLTEAIDHGHGSVIDLLVSHTDININLRGKSKDDHTALSFAACRGQSSTMRKLLSHPRIDVNSVDGWNCTALSRAAQSLEVESVRLLLEHPAIDPTIKDNRDARAPVDWLAEDDIDDEGHVQEMCEITRLLLDHPRGLPPSNSAVGKAIGQAKLELLESFTATGLDTTYRDEHGRAFLHLAATSGDVDIVALVHDKVARDQNFDINGADRYGASPLHFACSVLSEDEHVRVIEYLLNAGADPLLQDDEGCTSVRLAELRSPYLWHTRVQALFQARLPQMTIKTGTALSSDLRYALLSADIARVEAILGASIGPVNAQVDRYDRCTVLHLAIDQSRESDEIREKVLPVLIPRCEHFLNAMDDVGRTCAHYAVARNCFGALQALVKAGVDLNIRDQWGMTAFELAQHQYRYNMCLYLLAEGAKLSTETHVSPELLHAAVELGEYVPVKRAVQAGGDLYCRDAVSRATPLQHAMAIFEDVTQTVNDELRENAPAAIINDANKFEQARNGDPRVLQRKKVVEFFQDAQSHVAQPSEKQSIGKMDVTELKERLKNTDPDQVFGPADFPSAAEVAQTLANSPKTTIQQVTAMLWHQTNVHIDLRILSNSVKSAGPTSSETDETTGRLMGIVPQVLAGGLVSMLLLWLIALTW